MLAGDHRVHIREGDRHVLETIIGSARMLGESIVGTVCGEGASNRRQ